MARNGSKPDALREGGAELGMERDIASLLIWLPLIAFTMRVSDDSGKVLAGHKWVHLKFVPSLRRIADCRGYTGEDCGKDQG